MPMNHSKMTDEWIAAALEANPIRIASNGNIITCPVRIQFAGINEPMKPMRDDDDNQNREPKYGCTPLFPPAALAGIERVIKPKLLALAKVTHEDRFDAQGEPLNLHFPFRRQDEKLDQQGFTPGGLFCNVSSKFKPAIVDTAMNEITDPSRIYNGVWAILALNTYSFTTKLKRGVSLGIQMFMVYADDQKLVSKKADPKATFAGVKKIDAAFSADAAFGEGAVRTGHQRPDVAETTRSLW